MRRTLPLRRQSEIEPMTFRGQTYHVGLSRFDDGSLAETFVSTPVKSTSSAAADARDVAILISVALQHGASVDELRHSITRSETMEGGAHMGDPAGIGGALLDKLAEMIK